MIHMKMPCTLQDSQALLSRCNLNSWFAVRPVHQAIHECKNWLVMGEACTEIDLRLHSNGMLV